MASVEQLIHQAESRIRERSSIRRIRADQFFLDFDKLRSGYVSDTQFFRTLWLNLGLAFSPQEEQALRMKYDINRKGQLNWKLFAEEIDGHFDSNDLRRNPMEKVKQTPQYFGSVRPLSPESEGRLMPILQRMNQYYSYHAVDIRDQYRDFDTHNSGVVTESQFYRNFPGPTELTDGEITLLVRKYMDNDRVGMVNYMNLFYDLYTLKARNQEREDGFPVTDGAVSRLPQEPTTQPSVVQILDRIRMGVHRRGVRTMDFFKDYDKLRHDKVTEGQFVAALSLAIGKEAQLSRPEIQKIMNFFRFDDQYIRYKEFCTAMDNPYTYQNLEKNPLLNPDYIWPPTGTLSRGLPILSAQEEARVKEIISLLKGTVKEKRVTMYDYFKDYDHGTGHSGFITANQFARILHFLGMDVSPEDSKLLARKLADPTSGEVNYAAFVQLVDDDFVAQRVDDEDADKVKIPPVRDWKELITPKVSTVGDDVDFETLMARLRSIVLQHRIRVKPFFEDFDQLRSGRVSESQFRRCVDKIGASRLMMHDLTEKQYQTILKQYRDPKYPDKVNYMRFIADIDQVFTETGLEKQPNLTVLPQEAYVTPKPGTMDWSQASDDLRRVCEETLQRMRQKVQERRMLVRPDFQAFDKLNHGHVSLQNFRQLMSILNMALTEEEMDAVAARFMDDEGFNYFQLLLVLDPPVPTEFGYEKRLENVREVNASRRPIEMDPVLRDCEAVMDKIKTQVHRRRIRLTEFFRDFDKLRHGRMPRETFRRALDASTVRVSETELSLIEDRYPGKEPHSVDWLTFCNEVDSIFATRNLEKDPLKDPELFYPPPDYTNNELTADENAVVENAIRKIADKVRQRRMQLHPLCEDFDHVNTMCISQNQFRRVLTELDLSNMLGEAEWALLFKRFRNPKGSRDDVNYLAFSDTIYAAGGFPERMP